MAGVELNKKDNYGNTPIMMGVRYGTSDVLMVMLNCRYSAIDNTFFFIIRVRVEEIK